MRVLVLTLALLLSVPAMAQQAPPGRFLGAETVESLPDWFKSSFLELADDLEEAGAADRHVMLYFHQDGCPYCARLVRENFHNDSLVELLKAGFDAIDINIWGDRALTDPEGRAHTEKTYAAAMKVQFTPTLLFLNPAGEVVLRVNGYPSIPKLYAQLRYVSGKHYRDQSFPAYVERLLAAEAARTADSASADKDSAAAAALNPEAFFAAPPFKLTRSAQQPATRYLAVFFEAPDCESCDSFHQTLLQEQGIRALLERMQVIQLDARSDTAVVTPDGQSRSARDWYAGLGLTDLPAVVFFDHDGTEIIRKDAFFKAFHFESILRYVQEGGFRDEPNFQRYLEARVERLRARGEDVNIWD
ncbi:MAG TPA: thioredoxin fold domain-containing protein [Thiolinea sp.]|nr:thioredoxin fold domain-containing protein [Thiolinea sp.]